MALTSAPWLTRSTAQGIGKAIAEAKSLSSPEQVGSRSVSVLMFEFACSGSFESVRVEVEPLNLFLA